jgi:thiamine pyrophosphate-dependent acetolactate synthase large subunit-like protein
MHSMIASHDSHGAMPMDELIAALARAAGLDKALAEFPDDVAAAAPQALDNARVIQVPTDPAIEPWPPMRAGVGL